MMVVAFLAAVGWSCATHREPRIDPAQVRVFDSYTPPPEVCTDLGAVFGGNVSSWEAAKLDKSLNRLKKAVTEKGGNAVVLLGSGCLDCIYVDGAPSSLRGRALKCPQAH